MASEVPLTADTDRHPTYHVAMLVYVTQRGADLMDAYNRAVTNLNLRYPARLFQPGFNHDDPTTHSAELMKTEYVMGAQVPDRPELIDGEHDAR